MSLVEAPPMGVRLPRTVGGGSKKFFDIFRAWIRDRPDVTEVESGADVLVVNAWTESPSQVARVLAENMESCVIMRVDGSGKHYGRHDDCDEKLALIAAVSDGFIFQSDYSRETVGARGLVSHPGPVIHNPVPPLSESVQNPSPSPVRVVCVSNSENRNKGTWQLPGIAARCPGLEFDFIGKFPDPDGEMPDNFHLLGMKPTAEVVALLQRCHVFLHLAKYESCPNVVLEAMSAGLPVAYVDSGAVRELVGDSGKAIDLDAADLEQTLVDMAVSGLGERARRVSRDRFHPDVIFSRYLHEFREQVDAYRSTGFFHDLFRKGRRKWFVFRHARAELP